MGRAIAARYIEEGANVVVADRNLDGAATTASELGDQAMSFEVDVRDQSQVAAMVEAAVARFGGLDILVNNAGVGKIIPFLNTTEADWDFMFDINCKGLLWCSQAAARQMIAQGRGGKIVNLASQAGRRGEALVLAYCASKACVLALPNRLDWPWPSTGSTSTLLLRESWTHPSGTKWIASSQHCWGWKLATQTHLRQSIPLGRIEQPEDITGAALFLASSDSDYMTQQTINVDGGNWPS